MTAARQSTDHSNIYDLVSHIAIDLYAAAASTVQRH